MNKPALSLFIFCFCFLVSQAQINGPAAKQWDYRFGGNKDDNLIVLQQTADGGFILAGSSVSDSGGDVSQRNLGALNTSDYWIVKTDSLGNKQWDKRYGSDQNDVLNAAVQTGAGYYLGGYTVSDTDKYISQPSKGGSDFWIIKIDATGNKLLDTRLGGSIDDVLIAMQRTRDGGLILGGYTDSPAGKDVTQPQFGQAYTNDYWIVKTDSQGHKIWDKRFGGDNNDQLYTLQQTSDGGYILGGITTSDSGGSISQYPIGTTDYWIVKTDSLGNKLWDKRYGGSGDNELYTLLQTADGGYMLAGSTNAGQGGDVSQPPFGNSDCWVVKTDSLGNEQWDKRFGGSAAEYAANIIATKDGGYLLSGASASAKSGDKTQNNLGPTQTWLVKTDSLCNKLWDKTIFTNGTDLTTGVVITNDGSYVIANSTNADTGGYKTQGSRGGYDYWFTKFSALGAHCNLAAPTINASASTTFCPGDSVQLCAQPGFPFYQWSNGGINNCIFTGDSGDCYLVVMDTNKCIAESNHIHITVQYVNGTLISAAKTIVCTGDSVGICSSSAFKAFKWSTGDTGICISVPAGNYYVVVTDSNNCTAQSSAVLIKPDTFSTTSISAGRTIFCQGDTTAICAYDGYLSYVWSTDETGTCITATDSGSYSVTVADNFNCTALSNEVHITVKPSPPVNVIQHGDSLLYTGSLPCQWYSQGQPLPGETHPLYVIRYPGSYTVAVTDTNGCSSTSVPFSLTGIQNITDGGTMELYPNPTTGRLLIQTSGFNPQLISVYDLDGRKISQQKFQQQIDISELAPGIYFVEIAGENVVTRKRLVKL